MSYIDTCWYNQTIAKDGHTDAKHLFIYFPLHCVIYWLSGDIALFKIAKQAFVNSWLFLQWLNANKKITVLWGKKHGNSRMLAFFWQTTIINKCFVGIAFFMNFKSYRKRIWFVRHFCFKISPSILCQDIDHLLVLRIFQEMKRKENPTHVLKNNLCWIYWATWY